MIISGVYAPTVTVVSADEIDAPATLRHVQRLVRGGVHGLCPGGSGAEFVAFSFQQRQQIIALAMEASAGRVPVFAATGCYSTSETIRLSRWACSEGAQGLMVIVPWFMQPSEAEVATHFRALRQSVDVPIMVYQNELSGVKLGLHTLVSLAREGTLAAAKISQRDPSLARDLKREAGGSCAVFIGHDASAFEALCAGVDGWISGLPIVFPRLAVRLFDLVRANRLEEGRRLWSQLAAFVQLEFGPLPAELTGAHLLAVIKASLVMLGDQVGDPILPIQPLTGAAHSYVQAVVTELDQLDAAMAQHSEVLTTA